LYFRVASHYQGNHKGHRLHAEAAQWQRSRKHARRASKFSSIVGGKWATIIADAAGAEMKLFRKKLSKHDEKVLVEASDLAAQRLKQYIVDRRNLPPVTRDAPKKPVLTRLRWW